ncbi:MAG: sugar ABC transporter substrate-binding protein [Planctomycetota bacterium]|nr:MAG: sugar ABC transporter substrate-binding protein [Planctomycetota bacterium]
MHASRSLLAALLVLLPVHGCGGGEAGDRTRLAFVTNGIDPFWTIAAAGVAAAARDFDVDCDVKMPANGIVDQKRIVEDLLALGIDGIAISPIDGVNQAELIDEACAKTRVITQDSDAPGTNRLCFVGMDNYAAGRECGKLVKEAMPEGGSVMLFIGRLEQDNARQRRQGVIDELLDRPVDKDHDDPAGEKLVGETYTILATLTDQFDRSRAKSNAEDTLALYPDIGCMVGLFAYNPPACLEALKSADKLGVVRVVAFDENEQTLRGILEGTVYGTVTQQPYRYGYESMRILAALARGEDAVPESGFVNVPVRVVRKANCQAFWDELKGLLEEGE